MNGRFGVALAERNLGGRIVGASHWWRYDGRHDGYLGGRRWFDSERDAVIALVGSGFDPARWAVWFFPADQSVPRCRGSVADLWAADGSAGVS